MNIQTLIKASGAVVNNLLLAMAGLAVLVFFWGLVVFIFKSGDAKSHEEGRNRMVWGTIALVVMVSVWGIIQFVSQDLGITQPTPTINPCGMQGVSDNFNPSPLGGPCASPS
jgi:hypothetical protein